MELNKDVNGPVSSNRTRHGHARVKRRWNGTYQSLRITGFCARCCLRRRKREDGEENGCDESQEKRWLGRPVVVGKMHNLLTGGTTL